MYLVRDLRETRVYQEGVEEGKKEGFALVLAKLLATKKWSVEEIAAILELDVDAVRQALAMSERK